jgi:hypothetical protein
MNYAVEVGSGGMIYIPRSIKIVSDFRKSLGGNSNTQGQHEDSISLLQVSKLKIMGHTQTARSSHKPLSVFSK